MPVGQIGVTCLDAERIECSHILRKCFHIPKALVQVINLLKSKHAIFDCLVAQVWYQVNLLRTSECAGLERAVSSYAGGRRGKERAARYERSSDWRRGAAGSPDPAAHEQNRSPDPDPNHTPGALVLAKVGHTGPIMTTHNAGKMKIASGKISLSCSCAAFSSARCRRTTRIWSACTLSTLVTLTPSCSACRIAPTKLFRSGTCVRSTMSLSASRRERPTRISASTRANSVASASSRFSTSR